MTCLSLLVLALLGCPAIPTDGDGDGFDAADDCDDAEPTVNPDAAERCNGVDDDCDGTTDVDATDAANLYADADEDGFGDPATERVVCAPADGEVEDDGDCDDDDEAINPGATETCNGVDDDCDGASDNDATDAADWYPDSDGDGYGDASGKVTQCEAPEGGFIAVDGDCDDTHAGISPGTAEVCDGFDNDCDAGTLDAGVWLEDARTWTDWSVALARGVAGSPVEAELPGGTLHVCEGTWFTNITVTGPAVITGHGGREATVIDAGAVGSTVRISGSGATLTVADLTINGGSGAYAENVGFDGGGGILCDGDGSNTVLVDNVWIAGGIVYAGGGILAVDCDVTVNSSTIAENAADYGGGVLSYGLNHPIVVTLKDSVVADNTAGSMGGGLYVHGYYESTFELADSLIERNSASIGGGLVLYYDVAGTCSGDETVLAGFHGNSASTADAIYLSWGGYDPGFTATSCDLGESGTRADNGKEELYVEDVWSAYSYGDDASFGCSLDGCR